MFSHRFCASASREYVISFGSFSLFSSSLKSERSENNIERKYPELAELIDVLDFRAVATFFFCVVRDFVVSRVIYCNNSVCRLRRRNATKRSWGYKVQNCLCFNFPIAYGFLRPCLACLLLFFARCWTIANILHHIRPRQYALSIREEMNPIRGSLGQINMQIMPKAAGECCWYVKCDAAPLAPLTSAHKFIIEEPFRLWTIRTSKSSWIISRFGSGQKPSSRYLWTLSPSQLW